MKKIQLEDRTIIDSYLQQYKILASELSFTNLYAWRNHYNFHYIIIENFLWIINIKDDNYYLSQPIGDYNNLDDLTASIINMKIFLKGRPFYIKKADCRFIDVMKLLNFTFRYSGIRDDYDYIYDFEKMKTLSGNKFHKKKNHVNQFKRKYNWRFISLDAGNYRETYNVIEDWFEKEEPEKAAIFDVYKAWESLNLSGGIMYVDEKPVAFIIGESLSPDTLVIHFEKAISNYHGIYQAIFYEYLQDKTFKTINREQDLGIPGLRKSKLSYHPIGFVEKYNVWIG